MPGSPTCRGRLMESCFAVHRGSAGTGFWMRNQSLPGVLCLVQYKPGVVAEDLHAGPDDEDHQEQVEEVLHSDPDRQPRARFGAGSLDGAGIADDETLDRRDVAQALRGRHGDDQEPGTRSAATRAG